MKPWRGAAAPELSRFPRRSVIQGDGSDGAKLVAEALHCSSASLSDVIPRRPVHTGEIAGTREEAQRRKCQEMYLTYGDGEEVEECG